MSKYRVVFYNRSVKKEFDKLPFDVVQLMAYSILELGDNPRPRNSLKLTNSSEWRLRVGRYRVLYDIDDKQKLVTILKVRHRKDIYR